MPAANTEPARTEIIPVPFFDPEEDVAEERVLFEGLLGASDLSVWVGREKHRKTNVLLQLSFCAALGRDFMTFRYRGGRPAKVVYVDYETKTGSLKHRYDAICREMGLTDEQRKCLKRNLRIIEVRKIRQTGKEFPRFPRTDVGRLAFGIRNQCPLSPNSPGIGSSRMPRRDLRSRRQKPGCGTASG